jgi:hypothetical protein
MQSGRSRRTLSRNQVIDPSQPTRSASTVDGMSGVAAQQLPHRRLERRERRRHRRPLVPSAAGPTPTPAPPSPVRCPSPARPGAAEHRPPPTAESEPNPPQRSPTQSVWVASFSTVAMASFSSVVDTDPHRSTERGRVDQLNLGPAMTAGDHPAGRAVQHGRLRLHRHHEPAALVSLGRGTCSPSTPTIKSRRSQ